MRMWRCSFVGENFKNVILDVFILYFFINFILVVVEKYEIEMFRLN